MSICFNVPPNWPDKPKGWKPEPDWEPDPAWGPAPEGWQFWTLKAEGETLPEPPSAEEFHVEVEKEPLPEASPTEEFHVENEPLPEAPEIAEVSPPEELKIEDEPLSETPEILVTPPTKESHSEYKPFLSIPQGSGSSVSVNSAHPKSFIQSFTKTASLLAATLSGIGILTLGSYFTIEHSSSKEAVSPSYSSGEIASSPNDTDNHTSHHVRNSLKPKENSPSHTLPNVSEDLHPDSLLIDSQEQQDPQEQEEDSSAQESSASQHNTSASHPSQEIYSPAGSGHYPAGENTSDTGEERPALPGSAPEPSMPSISENLIPPTTHQTPSAESQPVSPTVTATPSAEALSPSPADDAVSEPSPLQTENIEEPTPEPTASPLLSDPTTDADTPPASENLAPEKITLDKTVEEV